MVYGELGRVPVYVHIKGRPFASQGGDGFFGKKYFVFTFGEKKYFVFILVKKNIFVFHFGEKK